MILAAGFGTRVSHLTGGRPKALVPYLRATLLDALVQALPENTAITLVSNAKYLDLFHEWARMTGRQLRILNNGITDPGERKGALFDLAFGLDAAGRDEPREASARHRIGRQPLGRGAHRRQGRQRARPGGGDGGQEGGHGAGRPARGPVGAARGVCACFFIGSAMI